MTFRHGFMIGFFLTCIGFCKILSAEDHRAEVFQLEGDSRILKKDSEDWTRVKQGMSVEKGDKIYTGEGAFILIHLDAYYLNFVRIDENTQAEFRSIEPADIFLSDGSLFSQLDGLAKDSVYAIATPTAVSGVRGTSFLRRFDASRMEDTTQVASGIVELAPLAPNGRILWDEKIVIHADEQLQFDVKTLESSGGFRNLSVLPLSPEIKAQLLSFHISAKDNEPPFVPLGDKQLSQLPPMLPQTPHVFRSGKEEKTGKSKEEVKK